jgi:hypothetical protein
MSLVVGVRCSFRGKDAGSVRMRGDTGATEDAASGRAARPGGSAIFRQVLLNYAAGTAAVSGAGSAAAFQTLFSPLCMYA